MFTFLFWKTAYVYFFVLEKCLIYGYILYVLDYLIFIPLGQDIPVRLG